MKMVRLRYMDFSVVLSKLNLALFLDKISLAIFLEEEQSHIWILK